MMYYKVYRVRKIAATLLRFTGTLKNDVYIYLFEGFENVKPRWELPCEYLSGVHFAAWNGFLLYSDGKNLFSLSQGSEVSEDVYKQIMQIVKIGSDRLKEINDKNRL